ncbi:MerR family transcriptional regulator [Streptomyces sp. NPDC050658]|uniref:MerR family transcriptional regulator n=1 Tax=unclassified Streptomyces TaxID=2593676 RepID=UPI00343D12D8
MRISRLAERTGVPATTLRFYESAGLLPADRTPAGHRTYGEDAVERLAFIGAAKHFGLPLEEIAELLVVWESGACADVKTDLRPRIAARRAQAKKRIAELRAFTAELTRALDHLDALPDRSGRCDPECGFLTPAVGRGGGPVPVPLSARPDDAGQEPRPVSPVSPVSPESPVSPAPVACSLDGGGLAERGAQWRQATAGAGCEIIDGGVRLSLPADRMAAVAALVTAEASCCPFFDFRLHLAPPALRLEVRAPAEGAALLAELFPVVATA